MIEFQLTPETIENGGDAIRADMAVRLLGELGELPKRGVPCGFGPLFGFDESARRGREKKQEKEPRWGCKRKNLLLSGL